MNPANDTEAPMPHGHALTEADSRRIDCMKCCAPAKFCERAPWSSGGGFSSWYYCAHCWLIAGPMGTSPRDRARGLKAPQVDGLSHPVQDAQMPKKTKESTAMFQTVLRLPHPLLERIDELKEYVSEARAGEVVQRSDVLREAIVRGVKAMEKDRDKAAGG